MIADSGNRREFESGAVRDIQEGKGREDLLPLLEVADFLNDDVIDKFYRFTKTGSINELYDAAHYFAQENFSDDYEAVMELAIHYEEGCVKYGERNWEKGIPLHCFIDSALRHYLKFQREMCDERHDRAFLWNVLGAIWTVRNKPEMVDMQFGEAK